MSDEITWHTGTILEVAADRSIGSVLRLLQMAEPEPEWVVVVRPLPNHPRVFRYAFRPYEIELIGSASRPTLSLTDALNLHENGSSTESRNGRATTPGGQYGAAAGRTVDLDATGAVVAVGTTGAEEPRLVRSVGEAALERAFDLGDFRGVAEPAAAAATIAASLSAETVSEMSVGKEEAVKYRAEAADEARPLDARFETDVRSDQPLVVALSIQQPVLAVVGGSEQVVEPPAPGQPRSGEFVVRGASPGTTRVAVAFRQGGSDLGRLSFAVEVVPGETAANPVRAEATPAARDPSDDDALTLLIEQREGAGQLYYEFTLHSQAMGLNYARFRSPALKNRGGDPAATRDAHVEYIYERVTQDLRSWDDAKALEREVRALGQNLCRELFDAEVARALWQHRSRINVIKVVSWEPYMPWELVRLRNPDTGDIDDRFLAEYGMIRSHTGVMPPKHLQLGSWAYMLAEYPLGTLAAVGAERPYFETELPGHGIAPRAIKASRDDFYDALREGAFDVLHLSCHAESEHASIERAVLVIGDEATPGTGTPRKISIDTITVQAEANLRARRPIVFLNGCETGRVGAMLTAWGGWPNVFIDAGAGVFVGTSWAVRDKPAATFSRTFYEALRNGATLATAASEARTATKPLGDVSWLAFKVYGDPWARVVR